MSFPTGWIYRQPVTVDNTTANGGGLFVVSNFQVPIALNSGNFAFSSANASGSDLVVTADSAGATVLNFWLQAYNSTAQTGTLWVQVPFLAEGATTTVYLWYGNAAWTASLGSYAATMTKLASGSGITELYHCDDGTGSTLAEAGGGTAATIVGGPPTWETVDGGIGLNGIQYVNVASPDFALTGSGWTYLRGLPYVDSSYYGPNGGTGLNTATWTIPNLAPGTYNVSVTYLQLGNRSAAAPFKVYDGATLLTSVNVNQQNAPAGITDAFGTTWTVLDATAVINSGTCVVTLTDNTSGYVIAGTVRLAPTLCNAPFSGAAISLNGTSQCVTIPGFQGVSMPAAGAIMFWYRNEAAGQIGTNTTLVSLFANGTGGSSSVPGNALWIYLSSNNVANVPQTITLNLATYVGGVAATCRCRCFAAGASRCGGGPLPRARIAGTSVRAAGGPAQRHGHSAIHRRPGGRGRGSSRAQRAGWPWLGDSGPDLYASRPLLGFGGRLAQHLAAARRQRRT